MTKTTVNWLPDVLAKINKLSELEEDWAAAGAKTINPASISRARSVAVELAEVGAPEPDVAGCYNGDVNFEWSEGKGPNEWCLSFDVPPDGPILWDYFRFEPREKANGTMVCAADLLRYLKP